MRTKVRGGRGAYKMDKLLSKELGMSKWMKTVVALGVSAFFILSVIFCVRSYSVTRGVVRDQAVRSITNISQLNEESITKSVSNRKLLLETIALRLQRRNVEDVDLILRELLDFQKVYEFYSMGILDKNHTVYLTDGRVIEAEGDELVEQAWVDKFHLTESYMPYNGDKYAINMFSYPVHDADGELDYVLLATYHSKNLTERMNISSMEGKGYTFLLNTQGEVVIYPQHYKDEDYIALMKHINDASEIIPDSSGDQYFDYNGEKYYAHFEELGFNNWFLMICAKESDVFADADAILDIIFAGISILWIAILLAIYGTFHTIHTSRKKRIRTTFYDELLDIGNMNALEVCYREIPEDLLKKMYIVVFDVDKFKEFNYIYGSENGDKLLRYIVRVVHEEFPEAYLFRHVADCFIALYPHDDQTIFEQKLQHMDDRVDQDVAEGIIQPFEISAGVRKLQAGETLRLAVSDALIARDMIKGNYLKHYIVYDGKVREQRLIHMEMETNFPLALQNKEFHIFYQPKYDIRTGEIIGAEALVRWFRSDGSVVSPGAFIPCFEKSYQIILLDEEILKEVCRQMKEMEADGLEVRTVSVNLSRVHLRHPDVLTKIEEIIRESGIDPSKLAFEITESALLEENIPMKSIIDHLHNLGCRVDMDDYGVGASNPDALISNNFDTLKLDKYFVDRIGDERAEDIIRSTAHMAMRWGMDVIAEGVEEKYQAERLVELGCSYAQGYYYSKPIPEQDYRELLKASASTGNNVPEIPMSARCFSEDISALLDGNLLPTYIVDPERFIVMYCNKAMRKYIPVEPTGGLCYQKMRGRKTPCESCSAIRLYRDGDDSPKEIVSPTGDWALLQTSPLRWQGREFIQLTFVDITKRKKMEAELHLRSKEYEVIAQKSITGVMRYDIATDTATVNVDKNLDRVDEYTIPDCISTVIENNMIAPDSLVVAREILDDVRSGKPSRGYDIQFNLERGDIRWCHLDYALIKDDVGQPYRAVISFYDNTKQKEKELAYQNWNESINALMNEHTIYVSVNLSQNIVESENRFGEWNQSMTGLSFSDFIAKIAAEWLIPENVREFLGFFNRERLLGLYYAGQHEGSLEYQAIMEGRPQWFRVEFQMIGNPSNNDVKISLVFNNVDEEIRERERLKYEAERDSMTGLYNRATSEELIRDILEKRPGERVCFLIIDLDDLREINGTLGHPEGDKALKAIANSMRAKFRKQDIMGRIGGDEFVVLMRNVPEADGLRTSISDFMHRLRKINIGPMNDRSVRVSVGGTIGTAGKDDFKTLYHQADLALFYTKATGKNAFNFYVPEMENREFLYQPRSTATMVRTDWYESSEFRKLLRAMAAFFPLVISVNLTKNTYYMMEYMAYTTQRARDEGSFDQLIADGAATFHQEDKDGFINTFGR